MNHIKEYKIFESDNNKLYWIIDNNEYNRVYSEKLPIDPKNYNAVIKLNDKLIDGEFLPIYRFNRHFKKQICNSLKFTSEFHHGIYDEIDVYEIPDEYFVLYYIEQHLEIMEEIQDYINVMVLKDYYLHYKIYLDLNIINK